MIDTIELTRKLLAAILSGLDAKSAILESLCKDVRGRVTGISAISFDLYPWHEYIALSLRDANTAHPNNPAEWKYFEFVSSQQLHTPEIDQAVALMADVYKMADDFKMSSVEAAHLIFMAGAEALLDPKIAAKLQIFKINAPVLTDRFSKGGLDYIVLDPDETMSINYCQFVLGNRINERLLQ
jgi:hypothetical protein